MGLELLDNWEIIKDIIYLRITMDVQIISWIYLLLFQKIKTLKTKPKNNV